MKLAVNVDMEKLRRLHCPPKSNNNSIPNYLVVLYEYSVHVYAGVHCDHNIVELYKLKVYSSTVIIVCK